MHHFLSHLCKVADSLVAIITDKRCGDCGRILPVRKLHWWVSQFLCDGITCIIIIIHQQ
jgi:hypothetical protein